MTGKRQAFKKIRFFLLLLLMAAGMGEIFGEFSFAAAQTADPESTEENTEAIRTYRDSIVRVESICWDGEDTIYAQKEFSGFVVSQDTSSVYVVTVYENLTYSADEKKAIEDGLKEENNARVSEKIEVVFNGDLRVQASVLGESEQRNLTVLKLEQSIHFDQTLQFPEDGAAYKKNIYLMGYPAAEEGQAVYNSEHVRIIEGTRLGEFQKDDVSFFTHDIGADEGCVGGPLLYPDGTIAGVLLTMDGTEQGTAIDSGALKEFLNTFQVPYEKKQPVKKTAKLPILNIGLGFVIVILAILLLVSRLREGKKGENHDKDKAKLEPHASIEYPAEKRIVLIRKKRFVMGRTREADFILGESKGISRQHACIVERNGEFYLSDMDSTNHTFLNGMELAKGQEKQLQNADKIMLGKELLIFYKS